MNQSIPSKFTSPPADVRVAFVRANWHLDIVDRARESFQHTLAEIAPAVADIELFDVPGSLEIPLQCQLLANSGRYDVIVAAGLIVDGDIYRHDFVAGTVLDAMMKVQLDTGVPILSVVLTPHRFNEQPEHQRFFSEHFVVKGREAAEACRLLLETRGRLLPRAACA